MRVTWLPDVLARPRDVAVGDFDGVHRGHREVIRGADTVVTFEPHPRTVLAGPGAPPLLTPLAVKADRIAELGVDELVVVPFDPAFAGRSADAFIASVLVDQLRARRVAVGENFRFGHRAQGDVELLSRQAAFETRVVELVRDGGEVVSSSRIRGLLAAGDVERANVLLGAPFELRGVVVGGEQRGRTLGFPTANLVPDEQIAVPAHGIYACRVAVPEGDTLRWRPAATSIGVRPTFGSGLHVLVEVHLIDFSGDLYGQPLRVSFEARLRGEERFDSVDALVTQMHSDVRRARTILGGDDSTAAARVSLEQ